MSRWSCLLPALLLAAPAPALAFSHPLRFGTNPLDIDPTDVETMANQGGGGGRYFTGSVLDGYTCSVCHRAPEEPSTAMLLPLEDFEIEGWPEEGYDPGGADIELEVTLPDGATGAAALEVVTEAGAGAGTLALIAPQLPADECPDADMMPVNAVRIFDVPQSRQVAVSEACGIDRRLRARWTPPPENIGPVWLNVAAVATADANGASTDDTVFTFALLTPPAGEAVVPGDARTECSVRPGRSGAAWLIPLVALGWLTARRRRRA